MEVFEFDASAFSVFRHYYPMIFPSLWERFDQSVNDGTIVSVREVYNELQRLDAPEPLTAWIRSRRQIFRTIESNEGEIVAEILRTKNFGELIGRKQLLRGTPVADPFLVAAAMSRKATVVTEEKFKPNAAKIPNVCQHFGVPCISLQEFMTSVGWQA